MLKIAAYLGAFVAGLCAYGDELDLPDPLITAGGEPVESAAQWQKIRRPEILELFRKHVYGRAPVGRPEGMHFEIEDVTPGMMGGIATRKRIRIHFEGPHGKGSIGLLIFIPEDKPEPVPCFLLICHRDPENIDPTRETKVPFWPAESIVQRGYAAAAFDVADVDPDSYDNFKNGVHGIFDPQGERRSGDAWGTIAAWAWGASRALDYLETDEGIDGARVAVIGHSRGGKTALWAGAEDQRFALAISNESGNSGAALARRMKGETVKAINNGFPHWFCSNYEKFNDNENAMPVDQHMLVALMAPRPVYVASAAEDNWADPEGEFLSCVHAGPVYELFGKKGVRAKRMPKVDRPVQKGSIAYHVRSGKHNLTEYDWDQFIRFADKRMR